jgi:DNA-binding phage protein
MAHSINPVWLATGQDIKYWRSVLPPAEELGVNPKALFSKVYDQHLHAQLLPKTTSGPPTPKDFRGHIEMIGQDIALMLAGPKPTPEALGAALLEVLQNPLPVSSITIGAARNLADWLYRIMPAKADIQSAQFRRPSLSSVLAPGKLLNAHYQQVLKLAAEQGLIDKGKICQSVLDISAALPHITGVQNKIRNLKDLNARLKKVTAPRGAKAALAREFGVTRQAVDQWLSGESNPSADIAIRLQHWKPKLPAK